MASKMTEIGPGFWTIRALFPVLHGMVDIGTHMALVKLSTGKFLVIDTCPLEPVDKAKINEMTENGALIEAVLATHPFHTVYFEPFHKDYPNAKYYGAPRHLRNIPAIPWAGNIADEENLKRWESEGVYMRIPDGGDFDPENQSNHFSGVVVYHQPSKTIFNDDTFQYIPEPSWIGWLAGIPAKKMMFWSLDKGLKSTKEAPKQFEAFVDKIIQDWDFDNICVAHKAFLIGGAKEHLKGAIDRARGKLQKMTDER